MFMGCNGCHSSIHTGSDFSSGCDLQLVSLSSSIPSSRCFCVFLNHTVLRLITDRRSAVSVGVKLKCHGPDTGKDTSVGAVDRPDCNSAVFSSCFPNYRAGGNAVRCYSFTPCHKAARTCCNNNTFAMHRTAKRSFAP